MTQQVVLITGGTQGLGADIAQYFVEKGAAVVVADIAKEQGEQLQQHLQAKGTFLFIPTDIQDDQAIDGCLEQIIQRFGRLDVLVNNACTYVDAGLRSTREQWHQALGVNLVSTAIMSQKAASYMQAGAVIINLGSIGGKVAAAGRLLYPASKAAILQITKNMAAELAPSGIRVVAVSPAWTWSPAVAQMANHQRDVADAVGAITHPLGRVGTGLEIAQAIGFLASDQASWITGVDIPVDGGFSILGPDQGKGPKYWFQQHK